MKVISVCLLLLMLVSSIVTLTLEESTATSKAEDNIKEGAKDLRKTINEGMRELGKPSNNYNDNENIQNEFDNSKDKENIDDESKSSSKNNNDDKVTIADELRELAQLKDEGIITDEEFTEMKEDLIK
jgi:hypothetical protein